VHDSRHHSPNLGIAEGRPLESKSVAVKSLDTIVVDMMNAAPAPLVLVDSERRLLWSNSAAAPFFETAGSGLVGVRIEEVLAVPVRAVAELCRAVSAQGERSGSIEILIGGGRVRTADFTAISLGKTLHLSTLHEALVAPAALGRWRPQPARSFRRTPLSARIAATVGHEIRGPLATALMYLDIARLGLGAVAKSSVEPALAVARQQIEKIENLVARMMDLQRYGRPLIRTKLVDAGRVVSDTVGRMFAAELTAPVTVEIGPQDLTDWWDQGAVEQIVQNLLSNALKFGEGRAIHVLVDRTPTALRLSVRDHGIGIAMADRERIFHRHVRAPLDRSGGLGLGLWLVRELARAHAGDAGVQSQPGCGSTFTVTLRPLPSVEQELRP
jgi:signal transduction histidine kinase